MKIKFGFFFLFCLLQSIYVFANEGSYYTANQNTILKRLKPVKITLPDFINQPALDEGSITFSVQLKAPTPVDSLSVTYFQKALKESPHVFQLSFYAPKLPTTEVIGLFSTENFNKPSGNFGPLMPVTVNQVSEEDDDIIINSRVEINPIDTQEEVPARALPLISESDRIINYVFADEDPRQPYDEIHVLIDFVPTDKSNPQNKTQSRFFNPQIKELRHKTVSPVF